MCLAFVAGYKYNGRGYLEFKSRLQRIADGLSSDKEWEAYLKVNLPHTALEEEHMAPSRMSRS